MTDKKPFPLPVRPAAQSVEDDLVASACAGSEPYALMVLGDSMLPEFEEGWIIVIEPNGIAKDGAYVIAWVDEEYIFRQLVQHADGWMLKPLNPIYPNIPVDDLSVVKGVVVQKKKPGRRKASKFYQ